MFALRNIARHAELVKEAEEKLAIDPQLLRMLLAGGAGAVAAGVPAALITRHADEKARQQASNRAFGAGLATGVAAPRIVRGLYHIARGNGLLPNEVQA
jgi:hypothetical protein